MSQHRTVEPVAATYASNLRHEIDRLRAADVESVAGPASPTRSTASAASPLDTVLDAESEILLHLPQERLRRRAWLIKERFRGTVPSSRWEAYTASSPPEPASADIEVLRADLLELQREIHRTHLLSSEVENSRSDLSRWLAWWGLAALLLLSALLLLGIKGKTGWSPPSLPWIGGLAVVIAIVLVAVRLVRRRTASATMALILVASFGLPASAQSAEVSTQPRQVDNRQTSQGQSALPSEQTTTPASDRATVPRSASAAPRTTVNTTPAPTVTTLMMVMVAGLLGALFSTLRRVQAARPSTDPLFELMSIHSARTGMFLSAVAGVVAALFLFTLFVGGLVQGALFPEFAPKNASNEPMTFVQFVDSVGPVGPLDHGKLLAWSFIAGFAERFVPDLIQRITSHAQEQPLSRS